MPTYVQISGHPTWVDDRAGPGEALLLLHGGLGNSVDDLLNDARLRGGTDDVSRLERTRAELIASYQQVRYAEMVSANF